MYVPRLQYQRRKDRLSREMFLSLVMETDEREK